MMLYLLLSFLAGTFIAVQTALNTRLGKDLKNPTFVSVESCVVGSLALALYMLVARTALPKVSLMAREPASLWIGGVFGATYVLITVLATPKLSVATVTALVFAGQMLLAVMLDHFAFLGLDRHPLNAGRIVGVVLFCVGAELLRRF